MKKIATAWEMCAQMILPKDLPPETLQYFEATFYCGAQTILANMEGVLLSPTTTRKQKLALISVLRDEVFAYNKRVAEKHNA